jgi:hypothetical protein
VANSCGLSISSPNINADAVAAADLHQKSTVASRISPQRAPRAKGRWPDERLAMSAGVYSRRGHTLSKNRPTVKAVLTLCRKTYAVHEASARMTCARRAVPHERHASVCIRGQTVIGIGAALRRRSPGGTV